MTLYYAFLTTPDLVKTKPIPIIVLGTEGVLELVITDQNKTVLSMLKFH